MIDLLSPFFPDLWRGMLLTLKILCFGTLGGVLLGTLLALSRMAPYRLLRMLAKAYVNYFRSIPLLLVILWFYMGLPMLLKVVVGRPVPIGGFNACLVAFILFEAAYFSEIIRAGIESISAGQRNASYALGLTYTQTMRLIILPQVFQKMTPLLLQQTIILFQDTTLVYAVGLMDFLNAARTFGDNAGHLTPFLLFAASVYFLMSFAASFGVNKIQSLLKKGSAT
jgi:glutamate/aspartate transport system permease protein